MQTMNTDVLEVMLPQNTDFSVIHYLNSHYQNEVLRCLTWFINNQLCFDFLTPTESRQGTSD